MTDSTPEAVARLSAEHMLGSDAASRMLGMELICVTPGAAEVAMEVRSDMVNGWDICHGGLIASLADTAFAVACNSHGVITVASGFDVNFIAPGKRGDRLVARANEVNRSGRSGIYDVEVRRSADDGVIAVFRGRSRSLGAPNPAVAD